ncbi:Protein krueppel [Gryllus bimaculatus]|nr:Protein krueppel [Gryllus bimaculatus]
MVFPQERMLRDHRCGLPTDPKLGCDECGPMVQLIEVGSVDQPELIDFHVNQDRAGSLLQQKQTPIKRAVSSTQGVSSQMPGPAVPSPFKRSSIWLQEEEKNPSKKVQEGDAVPRSFRDGVATKLHRRSHTGERPFACGFCARAFASKDLATKHERTHTGERPFACGVCEKAFATSGVLKIHSRTHTGERPYRCRLCAKSFTNRTSLVKHERVHTGEKPYACPVCRKAFALNCHLTVHKRVHTGEKPYLCQACGRRFAHSKDFPNHDLTLACSVRSQFEKNQSWLFPNTRRFATELLVVAVRDKIREAATQQAGGVNRPGTAVAPSRSAATVARDGGEAPSQPAHGDESHRGAQQPVKRPVMREYSQVERASRRGRVVGQLRSPRTCPTTRRGSGGCGAAATGAPTGPRATGDSVAQGQLAIQNIASHCGQNRIKRCSLAKVIIFYPSVLQRLDVCNFMRHIAEVPYKENKIPDLFRSCSYTVRINPYRLAPYADIPNEMTSWWVPVVERRLLVEEAGEGGVGGRPVASGVLGAAPPAAGFGRRHQPGLAALGVAVVDVAQALRDEGEGRQRRQGRSATSFKRRKRRHSPQARANGHPLRIHPRFRQIASVDEG